jgi:hypothetical protein
MLALADVADKAMPYDAAVGTALWRSSSFNPDKPFSGVENPVLLMP